MISALERIFTTRPSLYLGLRFKNPRFLIFSDTEGTWLLPFRSIPRSNPLKNKDYKETG